MSDNDLIRRGDALDAVGPDTGRTIKRIAALPARGVGVPTEEDREWIDARADELFRANERVRGSVRPSTIRPQDFRDYFVVDATLERFTLPATDARADAISVLSGLSSYLGAGLGDDDTTAEQFDKRIRWAIDDLTARTRQAALRDAAAAVRTEAEHQRAVAVKQHEKGIDWKATDWAARQLFDVEKVILALIDKPAPDARAAALRSLAVLVSGMDNATFLDFARDIGRAFQTHDAAEASSRIAALIKEARDE